jgi:hypothetical protein
MAAATLSACDSATLQDESASPTASTGRGSSGGATPTDDFHPIHLQGTGNKVARFRIPQDVAAIAEITHRGSSNFAVWTVSKRGQKQDLLVNTIGSYSGTVLFDEQTGQHSVAMQIEADGRWQVRILPISRAKKWNGRQTLHGRGDDVVQLNPRSSGLTTTRIEHKGSSNFVVTAYGDSSELLVNEIGRYRGESLLPDGTVLIEITADGLWSFSRLG